MWMKKLMMIWSVIFDVKSMKDKVMLVSYDLPEDSNVIRLLKGKYDLLLVLNTTCVFMDCSCLFHLLV